MSAMDKVSLEAKNYYSRIAQKSHAWPIAAKKKDISLARELIKAELIEIDENVGKARGTLWIRIV